MIDFHTHILPNVDDGSKSVDESLMMLRSLQQQGVRMIMATPHFYANNESVDKFIERRDAAYRRLIDSIGDENLPEIVLGAEVRYYESISRLNDLKRLRLGDTRLLLLEMPFVKWTKSVLKEVVDIANRGRITLVLAHIERYLSMQDKNVVQMLLNNNVLIQVNSDFFTGFFTKSKALSMFKNNQIHFIGSDCHNMEDRAPDISKAMLTIEHKFGLGIVEEYIKYTNSIISKA